MREYIALVCIIVSCFGCKENIALHESYWGDATARVGDRWVDYFPLAVETTLVENRIIVEVDNFNAGNIRRRRIAFYKVPSAIGYHELSNTGPRDIDTLTGAYYQLFLGDGDVLGDTYYPNFGDDVEDYIEITRIEGDQIWGKFQLSLYRRDKDLGPSPYGEPDYLTITGGEFHTRIWMP